MSRYDFAVNEEKLGTVCTDMKSIADEVRTKIEEIYNLIDNTLSHSWKSAAYDDFKTGCHKYEMGLYELANMIEIFGTSCDNVGADAEVMMNDLNAKF